MKAKPEGACWPIHGYTQHWHGKRPPVQQTGPPKRSSLQRRRKPCASRRIRRTAIMQTRGQTAWIALRPIGASCSHATQAQGSAQELAHATERRRQHPCGGGGAATRAFRLNEIGKPLRVHRGALYGSPMRRTISWATSGCPFGRTVAPDGFSNTYKDPSHPLFAPFLSPQPFPKPPPLPARPSPAAA
eukprot:363022-Chlamydomonas_euryale.AAC.2